LGLLRIYLKSGFHQGYGSTTSTKSGLEKENELEEIVLGKRYVCDLLDHLQYIDEPGIFDVSNFPHRARSKPGLFGQVFVFMECGYRRGNRDEVPYADFCPRRSKPGVYHQTFH
jgi:hypothetical protein